jgi:hypothetical protein
MARKSVKKGKAGNRMLPLLHPDAAGIDIGAEEMFVAVPADRATESVRSFATFTRDLHQLADWLQACGVYWIPLYQIQIYHRPTLPFHFLCLIVGSRRR